MTPISLIQCDQCHCLSSSWRSKSLSAWANATSRCREPGCAQRACALRSSSPPPTYTEMELSFNSESTTDQQKHFVCISLNGPHVYRVSVPFPDYGALLCPSGHYSDQQSSVNKEKECCSITIGSYEYLRCRTFLGRISQSANIVMCVCLS